MSSDLPLPMSIMRATSEANNLSAQVKAFDKYTKEMDAVCGADTPYHSPEKLLNVHTRFKKSSIELFSSIPKRGGEDVSKKYCSELEGKIDKSYESFLKRNESKQNAYRTPAVLAMVMVLSYLISSILDTLGVEFLSLGLYVPLVLLFVWMYIRYSGAFRELGQMIDNVTTTIWDQALQPDYGLVAQKAFKQAINLVTKNKKTK